MTPVKGFAIRSRGADDAAQPAASSTEPDETETTASRRESGQLRLVDTSTAAPQSLAQQRPLRRSPRRWSITGGAGESEQNRDRRLASDLVKLVQELNQAMDEAKRNGLIVEPNLATTTSQFGGDGAAGHMLSVKIFRKLT